MGRTTDPYMSAPLFLDEYLCRGAACCDVSAVYERTKAGPEFRKLYILKVNVSVVKLRLPF